MRLLTVAILSLSLNAFAADPQEEALILNQELQLLENSAAINPMVESRSVNQALNETPRRAQPSLEQKYFGENTDEVRSRTAAPRRRGF